MTQSRSTKSLLFPIVLGTLLGLGVLYYLLSEMGADEKFEELALGKETSVSYARIETRQIHCDDLGNARRCFEGYKTVSDDKVVLWLGNSQLHSINQMKAGDETAVAIFHRRLQGDSKYFMAFSQPNAGLQEHYLLFEYLSKQLPLSTLILPVVFDDMRETGIRSGLAGIFKESTVSERLRETEIGRTLLVNHSDQDSAGNDMAALEDTIQEKSERYLNASLESYWQVWAERSALRGGFLIYLYKFRNWVFGINPSSTRKMIPGRYALNRQALEALLETAVEHGVEVLLYIVPIRDDVKLPYDLAEYSSFKAEMQPIADKFGIKFVDFDGLIPSEYWGSKESTTVGGGHELDFMHFQAGGHKLLADALYDELMELWRDEDIH